MFFFFYNSHFLIDSKAFWHFYNQPFLLYYVWYNVFCEQSSNSKLSLFQTHIALFQHYTNDADGLCTKLITPLPKQGGSFFSVSPDDFTSGGWTLSFEDLKFGELIGRGEFGGTLLIHHFQPASILLLCLCTLSHSCSSFFHLTGFWRKLVVVMEEFLLLIVLTTIIQKVLWLGF